MSCGYQIWSEESLIQVYDVNDLHGSQRSSEVKCGKIYAMVTALVRRIPEFYDEDDLHGD